MASLRCTNSVSAAKSFIQLAKRHHSTAASESRALLEFLLPRTGSTISCHGQTGLFSPKTPREGRSSRRKTASKIPCQQPPRRTFATTPKLRATACVLNPRFDEDGKEMTLDITPRAAKRLSEIMKKDGNPNLALRIQVESGGCHGFQYLMSLVTIPRNDTAEWSEVVREDDAIFQFSSGHDDPASLSSEGPRVIIDEPSLDLLKGSKVDFTMELIGSQFKITDNPYASSSCGCGTSFDIKI